MIKDMNMNGQHKRILFMISLPQTVEFETCNEHVSGCINKLRERGVDVCESIHREDFATISQYDIVIIVAHHDTDDDALLLADGKLSMDDFVNSIPEDFSGELDFSSCYSASVMKAIKARCPNCHIQASIHQTTLALRLLAYPYVIDIINEDKNTEYHDAYMKVLDMMLEAASESSESEEEQLEFVKLGENMTSVYSPKEVMRNVSFQIFVFLHYDSEKKVIKLRAQQWQTNAFLRDEREIPINLNEDDKISISLGFYTANEESIRVENGDKTRHVKIKKEGVVESYIVKVLPDFKENGFLASIEMAKDDFCFVRCSFNIDITDHENKTMAEVVAEIPQHSDKPDEIIKQYINVFTGRLFSCADNTPHFHSIIKKKNTDEEKVFFIRKFLYNNDFFLEHLSSFLKKKEENRKEKDNSLSRKLTDIKVNDNLSSEISFELYPILNNYNKELQNRLASLKSKLKSITEKKITVTENSTQKVIFEKVIFEDALPKLSPIEWEFVNLSSEIKTLDYQIAMLETFQKLRNEIKKIKEKCKIVKKEKDNIHHLVTRFLEHPHDDNVDHDLFNIFKSRGPVSLIHSRSRCDIVKDKLDDKSFTTKKGKEDEGFRGATMPFLALVLAMVEKEYTSIDNRKKGWFINIDKYIDFSKNNGSLRTAKSRINKLVSILNENEIREKIKTYQKTEVGKISITAYYLLKIKISIT